MNLDELEKLAEDAMFDEYHFNRQNYQFIAAANPQTIKALIALCRLQHKALKCEGIGGFSAEAIAAYEEFVK